jgi:hypothetical protein
MIPVLAMVMVSVPLKISDSMGSVIDGSVIRWEAIVVEPEGDDLPDRSGAQTICLARRFRPA